MFSILRKGLVYKNISSDIVEHDVDIDADQWSYDGRDVYRGLHDTTYIPNNLNVYWLYDDDSKRVGLAEHEADAPEVFKALWFYDNPFATLFQDSNWKSTEETVWSKLTNEAYQDCLEDDFKTVFQRALKSGVALVTPELVIHEKIPSSVGSYIFLDDDFVIYHKSVSPTQQSDACEPEPQEELPSSDAQQECQDVPQPETHPLEETHQLQIQEPQ
jgi:hypothetical protein